MKCRNEGCRCTHEMPCEGGWIWERGNDIIHKKIKGEDIVKKVPFEGVRPCPTCDPERDWIIKSSKSRDEMMTRLQERSPTKKLDAFEKSQEERTRTL